MSEDNKSGDVTNELLFGIMKNIQTDVAGIKTDMASLKESLRRVEVRLGAVENHVAGIYATSRHHANEVDELRGRVEHLEDTPPPTH